MSNDKKFIVPKEIKGMTIQLVIAYILNFVGFTFLLSTMALTGKNLLEGEGAAGLPLSLLSGVALFSAIPFGKMADKLGRKAAIIIMIICYGAGDIIGLSAISSSNGKLYLMAMFMLGIGVGAMALFATAVTDLYPARYKGRASGFAQLGVMAANTLGYLVGGQMVTHFGTLSVYYLAVICQVVSMILIISLKKEPRDVGLNLSQYWPKEVFLQEELSPAAVPETIQSTSSRPIWKLLLIWPLLLAVILRVCIHLGGNFVNVALPVAFTDIGYSLSAITIFMTIRAITAFLTADTTGRLIDRYGRKIGFIGAPAVTAVGIMMIGLTTAIPLIVIGTALIGFGNAIANVVPPTVCNDVTYITERSKAVSIFGISTNIGGFVFPVPMTIILTRFGLRGLAIACGLFLLIPLLLGAFTIHENSPGKYKGVNLE